MQLMHDTHIAVVNHHNPPAAEAVEAEHHEAHNNLDASRLKTSQNAQLSSACAVV